MRPSDTSRQPAVARCSLCAALSRGAWAHLPRCSAAEGYPRAAHSETPGFCAGRSRSPPAARPPAERTVPLRRSPQLPPARVSVAEDTNGCPKQEQDLLAHDRFLAALPSYHFSGVASRGSHLRAAGRRPAIHGNRSVLLLLMPTNLRKMITPRSSSCRVLHQVAELHRSARPFAAQ